MAVIQVRFVWHLDSVGSVHETVVEQGWEMRGKSWLLVAEARKRGKPMPGVPERPKKGERRDGDGATGDGEQEADGAGGEQSGSNVHDDEAEEPDQPGHTARAE